MEVNRQWLLAVRPSGMIGPQNFEYVETPVPEPESGEVLVKNLYLSFDPAQRNWMVHKQQREVTDRSRKRESHHRDSRCWLAWEI